MVRLNAVVLWSGSVASSTLAFLLGKADPERHQGESTALPSSLRQALGLGQERYAVHLLAIDDGQPWHAIQVMATALDASYEVLDPATAPPLPASVASSPAARLFSLAGVVALHRGAEVIAAGFRTPYYDSGPHFAAQFTAHSERVKEAHLFPWLRLLTPLMGNTLADVLALGAQLGVPLEATWSCHAALQGPCGRCSACLERQAAFRQAGVIDQTPYLAHRPEEKGE